MRNTRSTKETGERRRRTVEERREVVARYVESGRTQRVFAREEGIGVSTLQLWLRQASASEESEESEESKESEESDGHQAGRTPALTLLEVELEDSNRGRRSGGPSYEVELPCGSRLRLGEDFAESAVRRLLALLKEVDC